LLPRKESLRETGKDADLTGEKVVLDAGPGRGGAFDVVQHVSMF